MSTKTLDMHDALLDYVQSVGVRETDILARLRAETASMGTVSRMQISPEQGQFMAFLVEVTGARNILEVGTFTGYSTLACATALPQEGRIVACDISTEWTDIGKPYWQEAGVAEKIDLRIGPAADTLQSLLDGGEQDGFDLMFIDADKTGYNTYYELGLSLVRPGGLILIDNVLWGGAVVDETDQDEDTVAIRDLNQKIHQDNRVSISLVPIGDGVTLVRRRA